ncbi:MAG: SUMF1/EgtB/PvdO family nonheme iron enzyme [Prosthecobacter sp.]|jgi:formylglycine-generating enzyme required for sulfatase activity|uniref:formylglycine-generating enzyme family protein n=1 Tax=Prosthecobacter sp. TaxID=1965333 RepID=UPI0019DB1CE9|nr:SUMF1/EgtB/PvdO family nonheme iron enzyme [Prosthecobacter sp.]MBE2286893.1 SUMF1/EgtB/PvdO family nonheme iron enzyme [Prosthecobacter sp.]
MQSFMSGLGVLVLTLAAASAVRAQVIAPAGDAAPVPPHTSSLGTRFVSVPGTTVMFAIWETRLSEWTEFLRQRKHPWSYQTHFQQTPEHPVVGVNLQDAVAFCNWLTETERAKQVIDSSQAYRLPTPDEWDAAVGLARGRKKLGLTAEEHLQDDRIYPWGQEWPPPDKAGNFADGEIPGYKDGYPYTSPVGSFSPSKEGLFDLAGNVWEWTQPAEIRAQPTGILRGGSWAYFRAECLTSAYQYVVPVDLRAPTTGFRCVFDDKRRTASLLAATAAADKQAVEERMKAMAESRKVDSSAIEELRKKMQGKGGDDALPDAASLKPAAADGSTFLNALGMRFVPLDEKSPLLICATETSVRDFEAWLRDTGRSWPSRPSFLLGGNHPAASVSWEDATAFCAWLTERDRASKLIPANASYRLPRDTEWSTAAGLKSEQGADPAARHLGDKSHYPWTPKAGDWKPPTLAVNLDATKIPGTADSYSYTAPVNSSTPNALGLHEMGGNVSEWCVDAWPGAPEERVIRGGSWLAFDKDALLTSARSHALKNSSRADLGFRCVLDLGTL